MKDAVTRESSGDGREPLCFGDYELDPSSLELRKAGRRIKLEPQPGRILSILVRRAGELVTRDELRREVWGDGTFVDFSRSLNFCLSSIRAVLNDDPRCPRYIETLPKRGYRFIGNRAAAARPRASVAVLPFENLNGEPGEEFIAASMTDLLIAVLGKSAVLRVVSRHSSRQVKDKRAGIQAVGRQLGVDTLVEGSVLKAGDHIRITVQLIRTHPERHLWAETYECGAGDLFANQPRIARTVSSAILAKLAPDSAPVSGETASVNPDAQVAYLRGRYHMATMAPAGLRAALAHFNDAIRLDPTYGPAYAGSANAHSLLGFWGHLPERDAYRQAKELALRATSLDDSVGLAHRVLGWVHWVYDWSVERSEAQIRRAIELCPSDESTYVLRSLQLAIVRQHAEPALEDARLAVDIDPLSPRTNANLAWVALHVGRYELAARQAARTLKMFPESIQPLYVLGQCALADGRPGDAVVLFERALALSQDAITMSYAGHAKALAGQRAEALALLDQLAAQSRDCYVIPRSLLWVYIGLGDSDRAFAILESEYGKRSSFLWWLRSVPLFRPIAADPRYADLVGRMAFPAG